jgi:hypothetical protein
MSDTTRVQRWREAKRQNGLQAVTVWLTTSEELRLKDAAVQERCSPSDVMQRAFAQYQARTPSSIGTVPDTSLIQVLIQDALAQWQPPVQPSISNDTDTIQLRQLIREELAAMQGTQASVADTVTVTVSETLGEGVIRDNITNYSDIPSHGTAAIEPVTDTGNGNVTDTQTSGASAKPGKVREPMRAWAAAHGRWFQVAEMATALGIDALTVRKNLDSLVKKGQFRKRNERGSAFYRCVGDSTTA